MKDPKFCIIAVDYENHVPRQGMVEGLRSISNQTYKNFEMVICHDGPRERSYSDEINFMDMNLNPHIINTPEWRGEWGHYSRDYAMKYAYENMPDCDYYIQFNIDNKFEPHAFQTIVDKIKETKSDIIIFTVRHYKAAGGQPFRGIPPVNCNIDVMQVVAHKDVWKKTGFWYRYEGTSDGFIYEKMCKENSWVNIEECLGDNY